MSIFSAVFSHSDGEWRGTEVDLADVGGIDDVADLMRDVVGSWDPAAVAGTMLLVLEADDEWFGIVRVDDHADPRVFLSDRRVVHGYPVVALLLETADPDVAEDVEGTGQTPYPEPVGDPEVLAELGTPGADLLTLTHREGVLPADALAILAERAGFAESLDTLRG
ncbi:tRNA adenosine deaminase-associated protein [Marinactinospora rubrisoli]|uniref:tRNA adenosine deaminase-associated protein n=1 Tax=Marinactinospora rubrisoli TaxID=2715399 RepID=A0ABW2KFB9_9ACTN